MDSTISSLWVFILRRMALGVLLVALPAVVYWPAVSHRYGFRDDYSLIQEAQEKPGSVLEYMSSHARPAAGVLLEATACWVNGLDGLKWMRMLGVLCIGLVSATMFLVLTGSGWGRWQGFVLGATIAFLPAGQLISGWGSTWPNAVGALLGLLAFILADRAFGAKASVQRVTGVISAGALVALGAMLYQPNSLFYLVGVSTGLCLCPRAETRARVAWLARHLLLVCGGLVLAFVVMTLVFNLGLVEPVDRIEIETNLPEKLWWFIKGPLQNALAIVVLKDEGDGNDVAYYLAVLMTTGLLVAGAWRQWRLSGLSGVALWAGGLAVLVLASYSVSMVASERWSTYRTIWPLTAILLIFLTSSLYSFLGTWRRMARLSAPALLSGLLVFSVMLARAQTYELIAVPQSQELAIIEEGARQIDPVAHPRVFVVTPAPQEVPVPLRWADEFGSLTTDSWWTPKEMLKLVMKARFPEMHDVESCYYLECGRDLPPRGSYDVVIDLRQRLKNGHVPLQISRLFD
jgi:hypothetical protein